MIYSIYKKTTTFSKKLTTFRKNIKTHENDFVLMKIPKSSILNLCKMLLTF